MEVTPVRRSGGCRHEGIALGVLRWSRSEWGAGGWGRPRRLEGRGRKTDVPAFATAQILLILMPFLSSAPEPPTPQPGRVLPDPGAATTKPTKPVLGGAAKWEGAGPDLERSL